MSGLPASELGQHRRQSGPNGAVDVILADDGARRQHAHAAANADGGLQYYPSFVVLPTILRCANGLGTLIAPLASDPTEAEEVMRPRRLGTHFPPLRPPGRVQFPLICFLLEQGFYHPLTSTWLTGHCMHVRTHPWWPQSSFRRTQS